MGVDDPDYARGVMCQGREKIENIGILAAGQFACIVFRFDEGDLGIFRRKVTNLVLVVDGIELESTFDPRPSTEVLVDLANRMTCACSRKLRRNRCDDWDGVRKPDGRPCLVPHLRMICRQCHRSDVEGVHESLKNAARLIP